MKISRYVVLGLTCVSTPLLSALTASSLTCTLPNNPNGATHYCPDLLAADLKKFRHRPQLGISHLKPGEEQRIMNECQIAMGSEWLLHQLVTGETFQI